MKRLILVILAIAMAGCSEEVEYRNEHYYSCPKEKEAKRAKFVLSCIKNANPKSDEEPEDWIPICHNIAVQTYCEEKVKTVKFKRDGFMSPWVRVIE